MVGVILIDYRSQQRTVQYIQDLIDASDVRIGKIVVVDNSPEEDNYAQMLSQLKKIGAENSRRSVCWNTDTDHSRFS